MPLPGAVAPHRNSKPRQRGHWGRIRMRVARPCISLFLSPSGTVVPRYCAFCKGGYDAARTMGFVMPSGLHRTYGAHHLHFISCSCYRRLPLLGSARRSPSTRTQSPLVLGCVLTKARALDRVPSRSYASGIWKCNSPPIKEPLSGRRSRAAGSDARRTRSRKRFLCGRNASAGGRKSSLPSTRRKPLLPVGKGVRSRPSPCASLRSR